MLSCEEAALYLLYAADDARLLDGAARAALKGHIADCPHCREELEDQRAVATLLRTRPPDMPSPEFSAALAARLDEAQGWLAIADWRRWAFRLLPAAGILLLAAFLSPSHARKAASRENPLGGWLIVAGSSSPDAILWQFGTPADAVVEAMLTGRQPESGALK
jgi:anti-sigma factor RsiW